MKVVCMETFQELCSFAHWSFYRATSCRQGPHMFNHWKPNTYVLDKIEETEQTNPASIQGFGCMLFLYLTVIYF